MVTNDLDAARILAAEKVVTDEAGKEKFVDQKNTEGLNTDYIMLQKPQFFL